MVCTPSQLSMRDLSETFAIHSVAVDGTRSTVDVEDGTDVMRGAVRPSINPPFAD